LQNSLREVLLHLERAPLTRILPNLHLSTMTMNYGLLGQVLVVSEEPDTMHKSAGVGAERKPLSFHMNKKTVILEQEVEISQPMHQPLHQSTDHEQMAEAEISHEQMAEAEISHEQKAEAEISHEQKAEAEAEAVCDEDEPLECGMALPEMKPEPLRKMAAPDLRPELRLNDDGSADAVYPDGRVEPVDPPGTHNNTLCVPSDEEMEEAEVPYVLADDDEDMIQIKRNKAPAEGEADEPLECGMALPEMKPEPLRKMAAPDLRPELRLNDDGSADAVYPDGRVEPVDPPGTHNKIAELDICEDDPPPSIPQVCGGVSSGDHNGQAAQDIVTELRSGVGAASLVASSLTVCIICRILPEEE
jgi:hypothetical protein